MSLPQDRVTDKRNLLANDNSRAMNADWCTIVALHNGADNSSR
jgi:hypothetical protein